MTVVSLGEQNRFMQSEPEEDVVDLLKGLLERAQSGDLRGCIVVFEHGIEFCTWEVAGRMNHFRMVGAVETAKAHLMKGHLDK